MRARIGTASPRSSWITAAVLLQCLLVASGCGRTGPRATEGSGGSSTVAAAAPPQAAVPSGVRAQLLDGAVAVLGRIDDFDEQAAYGQAFDRLNQWSHSGLAWPDWKPDRQVASVPDRLRTFLDDQMLGRTTFEFPADVLWLRDQRWLHDIAASARGDAVEDLDVAERLFEWVVHSLAIVADPPAVPTAANPGTRWYRPGEILLAGRASGPQRAWVFLELMRHAGLDAAMLATRLPDGGTRPWIPAVLCDGEAHLFDPVYGMPIPAADGSTATVREAAADPSILAGMNLPDRPYPVQAGDLGRLAVLVAATPESLTRRMAKVESQLAGGSAMRLNVDATELAGRIVRGLPAGSAKEDEAGLWEFPLQVQAARAAAGAALDRTVSVELAPMAIELAGTGDGPLAGRSGIRPLFIAKLREFRGDLDGDEGAKAAYLLARPSAAQVREMVSSLPESRRDLVRSLYEQLRQDAAYYLGLVMLREKQYEATVDYLGRMTLESHPDSRWADAARASLAEALLGLGRDGEARRMLEADESPQRFGSRLRAARIGR